MKNLLCVSIRQWFQVLLQNSLYSFTRDVKKIKSFLSIFYIFYIKHVFDEIFCSINFLWEYLLICQMIIEK